jgi:hypothetical protein
MAKKAPAADAQSTKIQQSQLDAISTKLESMSEIILLLSSRLSEAEINIGRCLPRESLVPAEVWATMGNEAVTSAALQGCISGILSNTPLHNLNKPATQEIYAEMIFAFTEKVLLQYGKQMNQIVKNDSPEEETETDV